jgi:hypothetical protein
MEEFVQKMIDKVGIDRATAEKVVAFLKDHAEDAVGLLSKSGVKDKLPGGLGDKLGGLF